MRIWTQYRKQFQGEWKRLKLVYESKAKLLHSISGNIYTENDLELGTKVQSLISAYKTRGHLIGRIDPLKQAVDDPARAPFNLSDVPSLQPKYHGFMEKDMDCPFYIANSICRDEKTMTLRELQEYLLTTYCGKVVAEFSHILDSERSLWVERMLHDVSQAEEESSSQQNLVMESLLRAQLFEEFCGKRFSGAKRFSLEGCESLVPGLLALLETANKKDVEFVEFGMAHRGRLNILKNVFKVPMEVMLSGFQSYLPDDGEHPNHSDDVRYHLGTNKTLVFNGEDQLLPDLPFNSKITGERGLRVSLASNPSHLEAVNAVVLGKARARQFLYKYSSEDKKLVQLLMKEEYPNTLDFCFNCQHTSPLERSGSVDYSPGSLSQLRVLPVLLHGDSSFFQGSVREIFGFSRLRDYNTGGTIHIVVNNQIGFTTTPKEAHSSVYCTDVAKTVGAPIIHVNADDAEKVVKVFSAAVDFRQKFNHDIVICLWGYRRHGHNEQDSPEVTQPLMYSAIRQHKKISEIFAIELMQRGILTSEEVEQKKEEIVEGYERALKRLNGKKINAHEREYATQWLEMTENKNRRGLLEHGVQATGVDAVVLREIGKKMFTLPPNDLFGAHPKVQSLMERRLKLLKASAEEEVLDWATAEALAIGSIIYEGFHVRLSGQDVERGTFNQRHGVLYDQERQFAGEEPIYKPWTALQNLSSSQKKKLGVWEICNSPLSEEAVLGFEHGYSLRAPEMLTIWEAQFGDFANGAQTIIDTFIASGEEKWVRKSGLVMLLPHGFDGQGPDHSSGKVERFLQLCSERFGINDKVRRPNLRVVNPTTPAQYFHILREQMFRINENKNQTPLVVFSPKSLLHHRPCQSSLGELSPASNFQQVIVDQDTENVTLKRVIFCSGKIYYHLKQGLRRKPNEQVLIIRLEQLSPFPFEELSQEIFSIKNRQRVSPEFLWVQEEPQNMGPFSFIYPRVQSVLRNANLKSDLEFVGRDPSASPATGWFQKHKEKMNEIVKEALG